MDALLQEIYAAAARTGLLAVCVWQDDAGHSHTCPVGLLAPDKMVLEGRVMSSDIVMTYPHAQLAALQAGHLLQVNGQHYRVMQIMAIADGAEMHAFLMRDDIP